MKILVSTTTGQGDRPGDFSWTIDGEIVVGGGYAMCDSHKVAFGGGLSRCGCDRAFIGTVSAKATTTVLVTETDTTREQLIEQFTTRLTESWGEDLASQIAVTEVDEMLRVAADAPMGAVLGQDVASVFVREEAAR